MPIDPATLDDDPLRQLATWLADAERAGVALPNGFALSTADAEAVPSVRFVLLRGLGADGLRFVTNQASRKGRDLAVNPRAAAAFWWPALDRQVRAAGPVTALGSDESVAYWRTRARGSQLSASASAQSQEIASREDLEGRVREVAERYPEEVPLPPTWGGYLLSPETVEFWESRSDRLHDRVEYRRGADGSWRRRRLQP